MTDFSLEINLYVDKIPANFNKGHLPVINKVIIRASQL